MRVQVGPTSSSRFRARPKGCPAIEEAVFAGVPINVTLLFSGHQYAAAAEAWLRGIERRIDANLNPADGYVASLFVSRWDVAVAGKVPASLTNKLGIAVGQHAYRAYSELLSPAVASRVQRRCSAAAASLCQHGHEGSEGCRHFVRQGTRCAADG